MTEPYRFEAILFDAYGTLLDINSLGACAERLVPGHGERLAMLWREKQLEYTRLRTVSGYYANFATVTGDALDYALERFGLDMTESARLQLLAAYWHLPAFHDVRPALESLARRGVRLGVLSNGTPEMLATALHGAALAPLLDDVISVDEARAFKTAPAAYSLGLTHLGLPPERILFVSSNNWDICGAVWFGYRTFWVNRSGLPAERLGIAAHDTAASLLDLADRFI